MMGSGGLIVMDEDNCMVDIAKFFLEFTEDGTRTHKPVRACLLYTSRFHFVDQVIDDGVVTQIQAFRFDNFTRRGIGKMCIRDSPSLKAINFLLCKRERSTGVCSVSASCTGTAK